MKPKQRKRELAKLYSEIPTFKCVEGCTACCGPTPSTKEERRAAPLLAHAYSQVENFVNESVLSWCSTCPYARPGNGCAIYADRPFLCRLFGTSEDPKLTCTKGCGPEKKFTQRQTDQLMLRYLRLFTPDDVQNNLRLTAAWQQKYDQEPDIARELP